VCLKAGARTLGAWSMGACFAFIVLLATVQPGPALTLSVAFAIGIFLFASMASVYA